MDRIMFNEYGVTFLEDDEQQVLLRAITDRTQDLADLMDAQHKAVTRLLDSLEDYRRYCDRQVDKYAREALKQDLKRLKEEQYGGN